MRSVHDKVLLRVDDEISYAKELPITRTDGSTKTVGDYCTMLSTYARKAQDAWTNTPGVAASLEEIRKIAAISLRCLTEHGCPPRSR